MNAAPSFKEPGPAQSLWAAAKGGRWMLLAIQVSRFVLSKILSALLAMKPVKSLPSGIG